MMIKKYFLILVLALSVIWPLAAQNKASEDPWFFIQITDPQFGMHSNNKGFEEETVLYEKTVSHINALLPDFVVITGDLVHDPKSASQIQEFKRITAKIDQQIPVYCLPGNHDVGQNPDQQSLRDYNKNYGKDRFSFYHKGAAFIGFNTSLIKAGLIKKEQQQYRWLQKHLKKSMGSDHVILFCHYPLFIQTVDEPEAYANIGIKSRQKYLSLFTDYQVDAVFSGHYHNNAVANYGDIQLVITSAVGKPLGKAPSGMRIIRVYNDSIQHTYYGLDEMPDRITFD